jgi:hypothetical protein
MITCLTSTLQDVIRWNEFELIDVNLTKTPTATREAELVECLNLAMPKSSMETIQVLLDLGAKLSVHSLGLAVAREEPKVFQMLLDSGWDINSTIDASAAIQ